MSKATHKYNKNQQKLACGRDRTGIHSAFNWNEVTCKACLKKKPLIHKSAHRQNGTTQTECGRGNPKERPAEDWSNVTCQDCLARKPQTEKRPKKFVHRYNIMGKTLCGIESAGHRTGAPWQITCEKCREVLAEKHGTADDFIKEQCDKAYKSNKPSIIHLKKAEDGVSWCGNYGEITEDINKCNCTNCKNRISDEIKGIICKPANVYTPADIQKLLTNAYVESGNKGKPVNIPMQEDFLALAMMKAGSIGADFERIMDANKQNRMVRLIINGLRVELRELRSYLQKHQEQLEDE